MSHIIEHVACSWNFNNSIIQDVDVPKVTELCKEVMLELVEGLRPFIEFTNTNHQFYTHLPHNLTQNRGRGLKRVSEESLEVMHKV